MNVALSLGRRGQGRVWPNPAVGCVIVKDGIVVGRGRTADGGRPHAETLALAQAGGLARGATAYVTLEPCAHHGQTPPCANALVAAGASRVVIATGDPDPRVSGRGVQILRDAGVEVVEGICADLANEDHAGFFSRVQNERPYVTLKLASTLDGRIATHTGDSQWITGPQARRFVHAMRASHDAVLVGAGTARADDPTLNVRGLGDVQQPVRVVISKNLDIPLDSNLTRTAKTQPVWLVHGPDADAGMWVDLGARAFTCDLLDDHVDLTKAMSALASAGLTRVFCEGGGQLAAGLISQNLVDELVVMNAGVAVGANGLPSLGDLGIAKLSDAPRFRLISTNVIGNDVLQRWRVPR